MRALVFVLVFAASASAGAEWTHDADQCARIEHDHQLAIKHCTLAINSGRLDRYDSGRLDRYDLSRTYSNCSYEYSETGELELALEDSLAAVELDDSDPFAWNNLGRAYGDLHRCVVALEAREKALSLATGDENVTVGPGIELSATLGIAWCHDQLGNRDSARAYLIRSHRIAPDYPSAQDLYREYGLK